MLPTSRKIPVRGIFPYDLDSIYYSPLRSILKQLKNQNKIEIINKECAHNQPAEGPTNPAEQADELLESVIVEAGTTTCLT